MRFHAVCDGADEGSVVGDPRVPDIFAAVATVVERSLDIVEAVTIHYAGGSAMTLKVVA